MRKITILIISLLSLHLSAQTTTYNINRNMSCTDTVRPFYSNIRSFGISIDGEGQLFSDTAFIRVVLVDNYDHEWLVYERNTLYATEENTQFQDAAFETNALYDIVPKFLTVTLCDATLYLANVKSNRNAKDRNTVAAMSDSAFLSKNLQIVERINSKLSAHKKAWRADTTFLSNLRFHDKKTFFGDAMPNLQGWDYYAYGYYSPLNDHTPPASNNIVKEFDWRTRHGSQNSSSYYYNPDGSGWIPKRRYGQVKAECWAFTAQYSTESMVNLYFNNQLNDELSVQDILSCSGAGTWDSGGSVKNALTYIAEYGVVGEDCFHFYPRQTIPCERPYKCENPNEIISIAGRSEYFGGEDAIKMNLITKGVLACRLKKWGHAMTMVGFGVVKAGDPILYGNFNAGTDNDFVVEEDSPDIGKPYYIFKQSYANYGYDQSPFCKIIIDANSCDSTIINGQTYVLYKYLDAFTLNVPITSQLYEDSDIACLDIDNDGYYNWGIGPKPAHCPNCPDEEDSDDSSPLIGPYNEKYESVVLCDNYVYSPIPEIITGNVVWGSEKYIDHDVIVENGGVLTVKNTMYMGESTKIIVKPGGKLLLDYRAVLTGLCGNMWPGIEVWGNSSAHQYPVNGHYAQGYVELKNGAVIENAECALALWRPNHWSTTGGIVHAENATFRNCAKAVHALHYANHHPATGKETHYNSRFRNCTFTIDSGYLGNTTFHKHIDLDHVNGISFLGCDFLVATGVQGVSPWCSGIAAYESGFTVTSFCDFQGSSPSLPCPDDNLSRCSFKGFYRGIHASNDGSGARTFRVSDALFENNRIGIHAINTGFATILSNDFMIGRDDNCSYGILAEQVTGFCIEENAFMPWRQGGHQAYGIMVRNSQGANDIYRNTFVQLDCGNIASGDNHAASALQDDRGRNNGLTYTCNVNMNNVIDFCVLDENGVHSGVQALQGSPAEPAGNVFSGSRYHFLNEGDHLLSYYYDPNGAGQAPDEALLHRVTPVATPVGNDCESHYGGGNVLKSQEERGAIADNYLSAYASYAQLEQLYENRLDGGSTAAELADIVNAAPGDLWHLRSRLMGHSPYLSNDVLTATADRDDVFPASVLFEVMCANPDELKRDTLISYLENKDNPLPTAMTATLRQIAAGTTVRTALMAELSKHGHDFTQSAGDLVRSILADSVANPDELRLWLGGIECLAADRMTVASFLQEGDFGNALALAGALPDLYGLQGDDLEDHEGYMQLIALYQDLGDSNRNMAEMTEDEVALVEGIAESGKGRSRAMAEVLLEGISGNETPRIGCPEMPQTGRGGKTMATDTSLNETLGFLVSANPNPATTWVAVDYSLPDTAEKAALALTNAMGVTVLSAELNGRQGQKVLDLRDVASGVYTMTFRCGELTTVRKIIVAR